ncbi:ATP-binding cassette domain-containing protein, partial [Candidatus Pacearchaeota archaeon]|nr:ATP-binding cassette domain-containing protein [Candidatus Pacearchaeota archaeon]
GLMESVRNFMQGLRGYHRSIADFHDLFQYGKIENEVKDIPNAQNIQIKHGVIEFNNVSFKYNQNELFKNFNLKVDQNQKVALVGHSGSGKSTLVKLIYRLYDLDKGEIIIDGKNIKDIKQKSLRSELSIVPQECVLFDDTIYKNISFSNPKATRREVLQAIKFAQLDKTISKFPYKEDTIVGERGVKLSGGEKQRVSIARAILANKKILLLDEATSSLDSKTESEIQKDLQKLMQGRTSVIIAHRLSTIMSADLIIVLDKGKIAQQGTHNQLISKPGIYRELWGLQKGGYLGE